MKRAGLAVLVRVASLLTAATNSAPCPVIPSTRLKSVESITLVGPALMVSAVASFMTLARLAPAGRPPGKSGKNSWNPFQKHRKAALPPHQIPLILYRAEVVLPRLRIRWQPAWESVNSTRDTAGRSVASIASRSLLPFPQTKAQNNNLTLSLNHTSLTSLSRVC